MTIDEIIQKGHGATYRYRDYDGNRLPHREEVWRVQTETRNGARISVLIHYGQPLVYWDRDGGKYHVGRGVQWTSAWLSDYALNNELTKTDKAGIRRINRRLV